MSGILKDLEAEYNKAFFSFRVEVSSPILHNRWKEAEEIWIQEMKTTCQNRVSGIILRE